jgi:uncharacterized protein (TIGR03437 family)
MRRLIVFCIVASNCLLAQPLFFRKDIRVGFLPSEVAAGDFNGDGRPDLAVLNAGELYASPFVLKILLNVGGGNFGRPILVESNGGHGWLAGDFNGDGRDDLVSSSGLVLISRGDGTFLPPRVIERQTPFLWASVQAVADFNRDGKCDLLVYGPTGTFVLLGNGDGTFQPAATITTLIGVAVVADFNHDGRLDVALAELAGVAVFPGKGDGTFGPEVRTTLGNRAMVGTFFVADFNGDGLPDIATAGGILLGNGDGSFPAPVPYPSDFRATVLAAADFTGDGYADLVVHHYEVTNFVSIYPGKRDGTLLPPVEQPVGWGGPSTFCSAVDLDGDGRPDLVVPNSSSNAISLLMPRAQGGPALRRAVSAASDTAIVAPESLATLLAPTPATASSSASPPWPNRLDGISLEVRDSAGATRLAPLTFVSPTQISFQVPAGTALGEATLAVASDRGTSQTGSMQVDAVAPGLFMASRENGVPAATAVRVEPDGTQVPIPVFSCSGASCMAEPIPLSAAGNRPVYLSFFGTGFRGANSGNVTCSIYGVQVPVVYAGPQATPGVDQINVRLPIELLGVPFFLNFGVIIRMDGEVADSDWIDISIQ